MVPISFPATAHQSVAQAFWDRVQQHPESPALQWYSDARWHGRTWAQVAAGVAEEIDRLADRGVRAGDRVVTAVSNSPRWILRDLACHTVGAVHVTLDSRLPPAQLDACTAQVDPRDTLMDRGSMEELGLDDRSGLAIWRARQMAAVAGRVDEKAAATIIFTSGTTGQPKGVMLSHRNLLSNARAKLDASGQSEGDVRMNVLPFSHAFARTCELSTWILAGGRLVLCTDWEQLVAHARSLHPTILNLVPYLARQLADLLDQDSRALGSNMRMLNIGGAAVDRALFDRLARHGLPPVQGYGLTEASPCVCANRFGRQLPGVVGEPVRGTEVEIDASGVLRVRGPQVMIGYWRDTAATEAAIRDGWLYTGDLATRRDDGNFVIHGRVEDCFTLSTGLQVYPAELERVVLDDPWVEQCVVLGDGQPGITVWIWPDVCKIPDRFRDSSDDSTTGLDRQAVRDALRDRLVNRCATFPHYLIPRRIRLLPQPLTTENNLVTAKGTFRRAAITAWLQHQGHGPAD